MQGGKDLPNGIASIKMEPGTSTQRLPSLRSRDYTLGSTLPKPLPTSINQSKKKTIYTPRLNVRRNRPQEALVTIKQEPKESKPKLNNSERARGRGKKIIQSAGIFAEGLAPTLKNNRFGRYSASNSDGNTEKGTLQMPKLSKQEDIKIDKEEEDIMLKELVRDDFVDDPNLEPDYENCPVKLPLSESNIFLSNHVKKIKTEPVDKNSGEIPGNIKIKIEPGLEDDVQDKITEIKLDVDRNIKKEEKHIPTVQEIMSCKEPQFVMMQLPSCLPGLKPEADTNPRQSQPTSSQSNGSSSSSSSSTSTNSSTEQTSKKSETESRCTLQTLKPGKVGKMQILKSGRVRLILGDTKLWLEMGTQVSFKQDLISVDLDQNTKSGKTICMGSVPLRMILTPDWEHLISS